MTQQMILPKPVVGFISAPNRLDHAPATFAGLTANAVLTQQFPLPVHGGETNPLATVQSEPELMIAARTLGRMGCTLVADGDVSYSWGLDGSSQCISESDARDRTNRLTQAAGVPALQAGLAIVDALRALGATKIALACTNATLVEREGWQAFLESCGFAIIHANTLMRQGLEPFTAVDDFGFLPDPLIRATVTTTRNAVPAADAIVVTGAGVSLSGIVNALESVTDRPVVGADTALYWACARRLDIALDTEGLGRLATIFDQQPALRVAAG